MTLDIKDLFLQTLMELLEYMRIHSKYFSQVSITLLHWLLKADLFTA